MGVVAGESVRGRGTAEGTVSPVIDATAVLASDAALPARDRLLDDESMRTLFAEVLAEQGAMRIDRVVRMRGKYRPGESLRVLFRVWSGARSWLVSGRMRAAGTETLYREALTRAVACPPLRAVVHVPAMRTVFWTFPNDRRIEPHTTAGIAAHAVRAAGVVDPTVELAGYAPERALVYRVGQRGSGEATAFVKAYAPGDGVAAGRTLRTLADGIAAAGVDLVIPRVLGVDGDVLVIEAMRGRHLHALEPGEHADAFVALGRAVGALHLLPSTALPAADPFGAPAIGEAVRVLSAIRPDVGTAVNRLGAELDTRRPAGRARAVIHGDLNSRNWLACDARVALFDLDQASVGDPAIDLGGVLAWMRARTLTGAWSADRERTLVSALYAGYGSVRPLPPPAVLGWHRAAALLVERGVRAITRLRRDQLARLPAILDHARRALREVERA